MSAAYSSGVLVRGSPPSVLMRFLISSVFTSFCSAVLSLSTIGRGVPGGASKP